MEPIRESGRHPGTTVSDVGVPAARGPSPGCAALRVGLVGLGFISHENVLGYLHSPDAEIVSVCEPDEPKARHWLHTYGLDQVHYYHDDLSMSASEHLDIVEILTPPPLHHSQVVHYAEAGVRGISVQKPMATSLWQCQDMIDTCRRKGVSLKVYENFLFYPVFLRAKELLDSGIIGDPLSIRVNTLVGKRAGAKWPRLLVRDAWHANATFTAASHQDPNPLDGWDPLVADDGFHKFSLARWFIGRDIETIGAWINTKHPLGTPTFIRGQFQGTDDEPSRYAQLDFSSSTRMAIPFDIWLDDFVEIVAEGGVMWINQCSAAGDRALFAGNRMSDSPVFPPIALYRDGTVETYLTDISASDRNWSTSFVNSTRHFIRAVREGTGAVHSGEDGIEIMRYIIASLVSARVGHDVAVKDITVTTETRDGFRT